MYFSTNPADWEKLEDLYISERNPPGFIRGTDLGRPGFGGRCVRGPLTPQVITGKERFREVYGARDFGAGGPLIGEVWKAQLNKPFGIFVVRRVAAADGTVAFFTAEEGVDGAGTEVLKIEASSVGQWGGNIYWKVVDASDGNADHFNLHLKYLGEERIHENLNIKTADDDNLASVVGTDIGRWVTLTKEADGRPANSSTITETDFVAARDTDDFVLLGVIGTAWTDQDGAEGTLVATDYTAALDDLAAYEDTGIILIPEIPPTPATIATKISTLAAAAVDRVFLTWAMVAAETTANVITDVATYTRSDRIIYCHNDAYTLDPDTGIEVSQGAHVWMASILSQNDVDVHPGSNRTARQTAGVKRLELTTLTRGDLILLRNAGIATLERYRGKNLFRSGVTTNLDTGKTEITRRRSADFLQISAGEELEDFVKENGTEENRREMVSLLTAFTEGLRDQKRIVKDFEIQSEEVNTEDQRSRGLEKILWRVDFIDHMLFIVLETELGTGVTIEAEAA